MTYTPFFSYSKDVPWYVKRIVEKYFLWVRSKAVDIINPLYKGWSQEYDPSGQKKADEKCFWFFQRRQEDVLTAFNKSHRYFINLHSDKECDIYGTFYWNGMVEVHVVWIPRVKDLLKKLEDEES